MKIMPGDGEMSWSLPSLSDGRVSLSNDGQVATQESSIVVRSEQNEIKSRKLKSKVWEKFTKYKGEDGRDWAICSLCEKKFDGSSKKGTTHLKNHLERCQAKRKRAGGDIEKSTKTRDLADIDEKSAIDRIRNRFDAKGMTTLQVVQEKKETGIVVRDQQNEKNGKKLKSKVWDEFTKYKREDGMDRAKCSICEKEFDGSSKKGTTHLKNHLQRCRANYKGKGAGTAGDEDKSVKTMPVVMKEKSAEDKFDAVWGTMRRHLLGESESGLSVSMSSNWTPPAYCAWSLSFSGLYPCFTDNWGGLPLAEKDSDDRVRFNFLTDALSDGWDPQLHQAKADQGFQANFHVADAKAPAAALVAAKWKSKRAAKGKHNLAARGKRKRAATGKRKRAVRLYGAIIGYVKELTDGWDPQLQQGPADQGFQASFHVADAEALATAFVAANGKLYRALGVFNTIIGWDTLPCSLLTLPCSLPYSRL